MDGSFGTQKPLGGRMEELRWTTTVRIDFATHHCTLSQHTRLHLTLNTHWTAKPASCYNYFLRYLMFCQKINRLLFFLCFFFLIQFILIAIENLLCYCFSRFFFSLFNFGNYSILFCSVCSLNGTTTTNTKNRTDERNNTASVDEKNCSDWMVGSLSTLNATQLPDATRLFNS